MQQPHAPAAQAMEQAARWCGECTEEVRAWARAEPQKQALSFALGTTLLQLATLVLTGTLTQRGGAGLVAAALVHFRSKANSLEESSLGCLLSAAGAGLVQVVIGWAGAPDDVNTRNLGIALAIYFLAGFFSELYSQSVRRERAARAAPAPAPASANDDPEAGRAAPEAPAQ
jgi:hypothetical protein